MNTTFVSVIGVWFLVACASPISKPLTVLQAPAGVSPAMTAQLERGNALNSRLEVPVRCHDLDDL